MTRRQPVAEGGLFSTPKATFSNETHQLLRVMMQESKLTNFQQRHLTEKLKNGDSLPLKCSPSSSKTGATCTKSRVARARPPRASGLRQKATIDKMVSPKEVYRPAPSRFDSTKEKKRLQNIMAYGRELGELVPARPAHLDQEESEVDRFHEVLQEIEERKTFLAEMEALGKDKEYRAKIMTEISQRVRELEVIDKEKCSELTSALEDSKP
ncbi:hypothetical protein EMCRGX_G028422 [Ephydatia muelleri]